MSIVDILEFQSLILAVSDTGHVILWDLSEIKRVNGAYIFKDNISLLPSKAAIRIDPYRLNGLRRHHNTLVMYAILHAGSINRPSMCFLSNRSYKQCVKNASKTSSPSILLPFWRRRS